MITDEMGLRSRVNEIVAAMVKAGYPVEATNKSEHRTDHIPVEHFGSWNGEACPFTHNTYAEDNFGRALVGGWHSKAALIQLVIEVNRSARALQGEPT